MAVISQQLAAAFRRRNTSALQGCLDSTEAVLACLHNKQFSQGFGFGSLPQMFHFGVYTLHERLNEIQRKLTVICAS